MASPGRLHTCLALPATLRCVIKLECHHLRSATPTNQSDPAQVPLVSDLFYLQACLCGISGWTEHLDHLLQPGFEAYAVAL